MIPRMCFLFGLQNTMHSGEASGSEATAPISAVQSHQLLAGTWRKKFF